MMSKKTMKITYIYNSGFLVETENHLLIFDYCLDPRDSLTPAYALSTDVLKSKAHVTVFVSHGHRDHFNPLILKWQVKRRDITFVFSNDIPQLKSVIRVKPGETIEKNGMRINVLPSSDIGVSYLVFVDSFVIYHAGDLNYWNWQWGDDCSEDKYRLQKRKAKIAFQRALIPLEKVKIDVAFFPLDPQTGINYDEGAVYFINNYSPNVFVPMHFRQNYSVCEALKAKFTKIQSHIVCISSKGQVFEYPLN